MGIYTCAYLQTKILHMVKRFIFNLCVELNKKNKIEHMFILNPVWSYKQNVIFYA